MMNTGLQKLYSLLPMTIFAHWWKPGNTVIRVLLII